MRAESALGGNAGGKNLRQSWRARFGVSGAAPFSFDSGLRYEGGGGAGGVGDANLAASGYGAGWVDSWRFLLPDSGESADTRRANIALAFNDSRSILWGKSTSAAAGGLSPQAALSGAGILFRIEGVSSYSRPLGLGRRHNEAEAGVPFAFAGNRALFSIKRRFERGLYESSGGLEGDLESFAGALEAAAPLYGGIPFYALFDPSLPELFDSRVQKNAAGSLIADSLFRDEYRLSFDFAAVRGKAYGPLIPRGTEVFIRRDLSRKLDSVLDTLAGGLSVHHNAVNIAGAYSPLALFTFYQNDELDSVVSAEWSAPKGDKLRWRVQSAQSVYFYGFKGSEVEFSDTLAFRDTGWNLMFALFWTAPHEKSLAGLLYSWFLNRFSNDTAWTIFSTLKTQNPQRLRREKLQVEIQKTDPSPTNFSITAGHESIIRLTGSFTLKLFADLALAHTGKTEILTFLATGGITLNVIW